MNQRTPAPPSHGAGTGAGGSNGRRPVPSGIFDDFNFRFSNTYTVVERGTGGGHPSGTAAASRPLANTTQPLHTPSSRETNTEAGLRSGGLPPAAGLSTSSVSDAFGKPNALLFGASTTTATGGGRSFDNSGLQLTAALARGLQQQEAKHTIQRRKAEKQAATLLHYTRARKPPVTPAFRTAAAMRAPSAAEAGSDGGGIALADAAQAAGAGEQRQQPVASGPYKPTTRALPPPALGLAAGVVAGAMGEDTEVFALTTAEQAATLLKERQLDETLFAWWDERAAMRLHERFCAEMDATLQPVLEGSAKDMIAKEETFWLEELCGGTDGLQGTQVAVNPRLRAAAAISASGKGTGLDMMAQNNGLSPAGATSRGLIVPLKSMETLFRGLRVMLHERATALLSTYEESRWAAQHAFNAEAIEHVMLHKQARHEQEGKDKDETNVTQQDAAMAASVFSPQHQIAKEARQAYLDRLLNTESELAKNALATATVASVGATTTTTTTNSTSGPAITPACVSLPADRMLQPLMVIETATSVALMWKILEQVRTVVPGMDFALQLFRHYILPHLYESYASVDGVLPHQLGSLSDQMGRFCALPLRTRSYLLANETVQASKEDVKYMEFAMKRWALRTWRKSVADRRRQEVSRAACLGLLARAARRGTLRAAFMAWRAETRESAHAQYLRSVDQAYRAFLAGSALSSEMDYLPLTIASVNGTAITYNNRTRVMATKLAEAATQEGTKGKKARQPLSGKKGKRKAAQTPAQAASNFSPSRPIGEHNVYLPPIPHHVAAAPPGASPGRKAGSVSGRRSPSTTGTPRTSVEDGIAASGRSRRADNDHTSPGDAGAVLHEVEEGSPLTGTGTSARLRSMLLGQGENANGEVESLHGHRSAAEDARSSTSTSTSRDTAADDDADGDDGALLSEGTKGDSSAILAGAGVAKAQREPASGHRQRPHQHHKTRRQEEGAAYVSAYTAIHGGPFEEMLARLRETEEVCTHLRGEIAVQARMIRKLEQERRGLQDRNRSLEADVLKTVEEKLHFCNLAQEKQFQLQERDRRIIQLKSRLRAHRNRPWQRVVMRVMGELCGSATQVAEALDEYRLRRDLRSDPNEATAPGGNGDGGEDGDDVLLGALIDDGPGAAEAEQERLFGELAPIVLSSTRQLPDALVILQDWANSALDDLQSLDDLKGGALSVRFSSFSEEARSGVLLSRLLFYLALPRYLHRAATHGDNTNGEGSGTRSKRKRGGNRAAADGDVAEEDFFGTDYPDRRRQLLEQRNVQLDSPFPVYSECFGDLLSMRPNERMTLLLQFATELVAGTEAQASDSLALKRQAVEEAVFAATDLTMPLAAGRIELQEVIDPHSLAAGERASVVTFVALLYTRFAHPFNHKCRQSAAVERAALLHLLSGGTIVSTDARGRHETFGGGDVMTLGSLGNGGRNASASAAVVTSLEEQLLAHLDDEDKSPWQLFKERCLPMFGTDAHPFLLRGNFWPSDAFDSPALANLLGELGMALNRSLQLHRWHVTLSCLVPVITYSGLSRAVFTGPRASPAALRVGLEQEGEWEFPLHGSCIKRVCERRGIALGCLTEGGTPTGTLTGPARLVQHVRAEKNRLMAALKLSSEDILGLFLRRSTLSAELALPTMDLGGWRLLCGDLGFVGLEIGNEDEFPLDLQAATDIYFEAVAALNEAAEAPKLFAVTADDTAAHEGKSYSAILQQKRLSALSFKGADTSPEVVPLQSSALDRLRHRQPPLEQADQDPQPPGRGARQEERPSFAAQTSVDPSHGWPSPTDYGVLAFPHESLNMSGGKSSYEGVFAPLPVAHMAMTFTAFATALVLVADHLYPASRPLDEKDRAAQGQDAWAQGYDTADDKYRVAAALGEDGDADRPHRWLGDALRALVREHVLESPAGNLLLDEPRAVIRRLQMGAATQEVIALHTPALTLVFNAYSKDVYGSAGMEREDLMALLRDAMLTSTEISQYLVYELFQYCCVSRRPCEEEAAAKRRELDNRSRSPGTSASSAERRRTGRAVSILDPRTNAVSLSSGKRKDIQVLVMEGFIEFLCVLCHFKQPNPLIPVHQRFSVFLRRSVLRPLSHKVEGITSFLNQLKITREAQEAAEEGERRGPEH